jgi:hypothetical protein
MPGFHEYPDNPMLDAEMKYKRETIKAVKKFKQTNPWKGSREVRTMKFDALLAELKVIYNKPSLRCVYECQRPYFESFSSCYSPYDDLITMRGRFSVITFLHEFAHALGRDEYGAVKWSTNLFAKVFPEKMAALSNSGHVLTINRAQEVQ